MEKQKPERLLPLVRKLDKGQRKELMNKMQEMIQENQKKPKKNRISG